MRIQVELRVGDGYVAAWVSGVPVHAEEPTLKKALDELASALIAYAATWETSLRHAPNHAGNEDLVRRVQSAGTVEAVREMLEVDAGKRGVAEWERDNGPLTPAERSAGLARARALLFGWNEGNAWPWMHWLDKDDRARCFCELYDLFLDAQATGNVARFNDALHAWQVTAESRKDERAREGEAGGPPAGPPGRAAGGESAKLAEALEEFLAAWEAEHGAITEEELAAAGMRLGLEARTTRELERERRAALAEMSQAVREDGGFLGRFAPPQGTDRVTAVPSDAMSKVDDERDVAGTHDWSF